MKLNLWIIYLLFIVINLQAQDFKLNMTKIEPQKKDAGSILSSCTKGNQFYSVRYSDEKEVQLTIRCASDLKINKQRVIIGGRKTTKQTLSDNFNFVDLVRLKEKIYLLVNTVEKKKDEHVLLAQEIGENGAFIGALKKIDKTSIERKSNMGGFVVKVSNDTTKLLVISSPPYHKKSQESFNFKTLDDKLSSLSKMQVALSHTDKDFALKQVLFNADGHVVFSGYYELDSKETNRDHEKEKVEVYVLSPVGELKTFEISIPTLEILNFSIDFSEDGQLVFFNASYRNLAEGKKDELHGIVAVTLDINKKEIVCKQVNKFSKALISKVLDEKINKIRTKDGLPIEYALKDVVVNTDNTRWFMLEHRYRVSNKYGTTYYFKEMVALLISENGEIVKDIFIPKNQAMGSPCYRVGSFNCLKANDRLFVIFNDHEDNLSKDSKTFKGVKKAVNVKKTCLFAVELKRDGSFQKRILYTNEDKVCFISENFSPMNGEVVYEVRELSAFELPKYKGSALCKITL